MEIWKDVPGYEGQYRVSDAGNVMSYRQRAEGRLLRPGRMPVGHMSVALGRGNSQCVHKLVLLAFVGPPPPKHECRHLNGNPSDNRLANLRWGTRSENIRDKTLHDQCKLKVADIRTIRKALETVRHGQQRELAKAYGVSEGTISAIKTGRTHGYLVR